MKTFRQLIKRKKNREVDIINRIYTDGGFHSVLEYIRMKLDTGHVTQVEDGLYQITTNGRSENEHLLREVNNSHSLFRHKHYVGYIVGGAYYYCENKDEVEHVGLYLTKNVMNSCVPCKHYNTPPGNMCLCDVCVNRSMWEMK